MNTSSGTVFGMGDVGNERVLSLYLKPRLFLEESHVVQAVCLVFAVLTVCCAVADKFREDAFVGTALKPLGVV